MFTAEQKLAGIRRREQGISLGDVARAQEVNSDVVHRWRREICLVSVQIVAHPSTTFPDGNFRMRRHSGGIRSCRCER